MNAKLINLLTILKEDSDGYRARAFDLAIINISKLTYEICADFERFSAETKSKQVKGVGSGILDRVREFCETGTIAEADLAVEESSVIGELTRIKGVGTKIAKEWFDMGIKSLADVRRAIAQHKITPTLAQKYGILYYADLNERIPRSEIEAYVATIRPLFSHIALKLEVVGSYRRGAKSSGDIDILICAKNPATIDVEQILSDDPSFIDIIADGELATTYLMKFATKVRQCDILLCDPTTYPTALLYFTGSREHGIMLRKHAKQLNLKLNQYGLFRGSARIAVKSESDVYAKLGLKYVRPESR